MQQVTLISSGLSRKNIFSFDIFGCLSRFHELSEFDEAKRSFRGRLAGHNERRRKTSGDSFGEGSGPIGFNGQLIQINKETGYT